MAWVYENCPDIYSETGTPGRATSSQTWASGMPSDFGSNSTSSWIYSIYADYIPTNIVGITEVAGTVTNPDRRAMPYTFEEDGILHSVSIYHNDVWRGLPARVFVGKMPTTQNSRKFHSRLADCRAY